MYSTSTPKKSKLGTGYLARPKLGALKNTYTSRPPSRPSSGYGSDKRKKIRKPPSLTKIEYAKKPDYADTAYRDAVSRLRILLAESYIPVRRPLRELDSAGEETDNQSVISGGSRTSRIGRNHYHSPLTPRRYNLTAPLRSTNVNLGDSHHERSLGDHHSKWDTGCHTAPPELMSFIERQEEYIEQLERESRFCRNQLSDMLGKVKEVISENENLHEKQKSNLLKSVFDHLETETETETDVDIVKNIPKSPKHISKHRPLEGPTIVFESRISELEAQLTQTKIDLKKAQDENETFKRKLSDGTYGEGLDSYKKQVENLQREKTVLQDTVSKLQNALAILRDKENSTCDQAKRSLDVAEQAQYEKTAAEHEIRRLKDELERQHGKLRDSINEQSRRIADERSAVERRYSQQIEQLTAELGVQWEQTNKLQLEIDKQRRENADLRRELTQKQAHIDDLKKDMSNKIISLQSDIGVSGAEKSALEQQIATLQMANERQERQGKQETLRLQAEMQSLRQRLDRADADLIHSRRENIRLTEQVANLEKELKMNEALAEERTRRSPCSGSSAGDIMALPPPKEHGEKELSTMIQDIETKHAATVAELEGMIHSQNQLMDKLSNECHVLTEKLEEANTRHKRESGRLRDENDELMRKLETVWISLKRVRNVHDVVPPPPASNTPQTPARSRQPMQQQVTFCRTSSINRPLLFYREEIRELQTNLDYISSRFTLPTKTTADQDKERPALYQSAPITTSSRELSGTQKPASYKPETPLPQPKEPRPQVEPPKKTVPKVTEQTVALKSEKEPITQPKSKELVEEPAATKEVIRPIEDLPKAPVEIPKPYQKQEKYEEEYSGDPNTQYPTEQYEPDQQYIADQQYEDGQQYLDQAYDQQYMTQEQYEQQYGQYDPNAEYSDQQYDSNYPMEGQYEGNSQYMGDQQYVEDPQYTTDQYLEQIQENYPEQRVNKQGVASESAAITKKVAEPQQAQQKPPEKLVEPQIPSSQQYSSEPPSNQQNIPEKVKTPSPTAKK
ncbi:hypothetical protein Trydic_g2897 [Trypoxylus dichotomus]